MNWFKCLRCPRVSATIPSATHHYLTSHNSREEASRQTENEDNSDDEGTPYCTPVQFRQVRIVLTRIEETATDDRLPAKRTREIRLDTMKAFEIERVMASLFFKKKEAKCDRECHEKNSIREAKDTEEEGTDSDEESSDDSDCSSEDSDYVPTGGEIVEDDNSESEKDDEEDHPSEDDVVLKEEKTQADDVVEMQGDETFLSRKFKCYLCKSGLDRQNDYIQHMRDNHLNQKNEYSCPRCSQSFARLKKFGLHMRREIRGGPIKRCRRNNTTGKTIKTSARKLVARGSLQCDLCDKVLTSRGGLQKHLKLHKANRMKIVKKTLFPCPLCSSKLQNEKTYKEHLSLHLPGNPYTCKVDGCNQVFRNRFHHRNHMAVHTDIRTKYMCSYCSSVTWRLHAVKQHIVRDHPREPLKYTAFQWKGDTRHGSNKFKFPHPDKVKTKKETAVKEDEYRVEVGNIDLDEDFKGPEQSPVIQLDEERARIKVTVIDADVTKTNKMLDHAIEQYPDLLKKMNRLKAKQRKMTLKCSECEWIGIYHFCFMSHVRKEHAGVSARAIQIDPRGKEKGLPDKLTLLCGNCGFPADNATSLAEHMRLDHPKSKKFRCPICGLTFSTEYKREEHVDFVHNAEKKYVCHVPSCEKSYSRQDGLLKHVRKSHSSATLECKRCKQVFPDLEAFRLHQLSSHQSQRRKHQCKSCHGIYATPATLRRHIRFMHGGGGHARVLQTDHDLSSEGKEDTTAILGI